MLFVEYPKCSTCQKAKKWLIANSVSFDDRHIVEERPTAQELKKWIGMSGLPIQKFFNTSGNLYKSMELKNRLPELSDDEKIELLASNGMLVKRPIVVGDNFVLVGFKEEQWQNALMG